MIAILLALILQVYGTIILSTGSLSQNLTRSTHGAEVRAVRWMSIRLLQISRASCEPLYRSSYRFSLLTVP